MHQYSNKHRKWQGMCTQQAPCGTGTEFFLFCVCARIHMDIRGCIEGPSGASFVSESTARRLALLCPVRQGRGVAGGGLSHGLDAVPARRAH